VPGKSPGLGVNGKPWAKLKVAFVTTPGANPMSVAPLRIRRVGGPRIQHVLIAVFEDAVGAG